MGVRVVVLDDNPHVSWEGRVYPANATFHRFLSAVLDVPGRPVESIIHAVPLRAAAEPPRTLPLDPRLEVVGTAPFDGIAGFLGRAPAITRRNAPVLRAALRGADLLWLKVPASNALLAAWLARGARVPRFVYVAGSASDVVRGQKRGPMGGLAARLVALTYDGIGRLVAIGGDRVVVGDEIVTSLVEPEDIADAAAPWPREPARLRLAWAGRLVAGKGLETVLEAVALLPRHIELAILGDGPDRGRLEEHAASLGIAGRVSWLGYIADRGRYMSELSASDVFAFPSPAEGFPKAVLEAMAAGLPVVAAPAGSLRGLAPGTIAPVPATDPAALRSAVERLAGDREAAARLRRAGLAFAAAHTAPAEAVRLVERWRARFPALPWG